MTSSPTSLVAGSGPIGWHPGDPAPEPLPVPSEEEVVRYWIGERPVVSVICPTYQHAGFIEAALRGFLAQRTDFPFEVIVRDDGSTDGTADIVHSYSLQFPNIIRPILEPVNTRGSVSAHQALVDRARGEFIAHCDGDDYWLDTGKLATQVASLRANPWAVLSHHQSMVVRAGRIHKVRKLKPEWCRNITQPELRRGARVLGNTIVYRNIAISMPPRRPGLRNSDLLRRVLIAEHGGAVYEPHLLPAIYREHPGGMWSSLDDRE